MLRALQRRVPKKGPNRWGGKLTKDEICVETCPVDCIHPKKDEPGFAEASHLFLDPEACIDCGACIPVCPTNSVFALDDLPAELAQFAEKNAAYYSS